MKILRNIEGKFSLVLILAIVVLCVGFVIVSCGKKPQQKTKNSDKGTFAIDFSRCPTGKNCTATPKGSETTRIPDISDRQVTLEAWVKTSVTTTSGNIFNRSDGSRGVELRLDNNVPTFKIQRVIVVQASPLITSSDPYMVSAPKLATDTWYHITGVIASADSHLAETPHLDIYLNGEYKNSATTNLHYADNPETEEMLIGSVNGTVVDELRFWVTGRTESQIRNCKDIELGIGGECDRGDANLAAYYRLNEGEGADITDFSGHGFAGGFEYSVGEGEFEPWEDGWVTPGAVAPAD